ncbi:cell envelope biogenesis protein TolA [Sphingomonas sp. MMS24-J45]|uniref:cell envelope biogenesis protein TolA n=1 Tax=Sphingomonas sp. MMS24-J45 TaxID=3238806 RepID=UPI00384C19C6
MTKGERVGLAVAAIGHVALFAILSVVWSAKPVPLPTPKPVEVSLVDDVALDQTAPPAPEPPSQSTAPDPGPPEDAPPAAEPEPEPAPEPKPAPPKPAPAKPAPIKPQAQPKPDAVPPPKPAPKPAPVKKPVAEKAPQPEKAKPSPAKANTLPAKTAVAATKTAGSNPRATKARPSGSLLDDDFRKGLSQTPSKAKATEAAPGATMDAKAAADIGSAIRRQVQPCADRQVNPGPGASRIVVTIALSLNRDGSLAARPTVADDHGGVDDENRRYVDAVDRAAIAAFMGCAPLRGLPADLYDVPRGWKSFKLRYKLPD